MKALLKFLAWLAATAAFLLATAHFTLRHSLNTPKFKAAATGFIERTTGRPADYARIDYTIFPFTLVLRQASLKEPDGQTDFAAMEELAAVMDFRAKEIASLTLRKPTLRIVQRPDGSYNFSDLLPAPEPALAPGEPRAPQPSGRPKPPAGEKEPQPAATPLAIRLVQVEKARFEFVKQAAGQPEKSFTVSDLDFLVQDFAPDRPVRFSGQARLGATSAFQFELSGPPPAEYRDNPGTWPVGFNSRLDIRDFADLAAFLPPDTRPLQSLCATLSIQGAVADRMTVLLNLATPPEPSGPFRVALQADLQAEVTLPAPVAAHLLAGAPLPDSLKFTPPACEPPPGTLTLTDDPLLALLLKHLQGTVNLTFPLIHCGQNHLTEGRASLEVRDGVLTIPGAKAAAYGGTLEARGEVQLLACPLTYRFDRIAVDNLALDQALAANGLGAYTNFSGRLHLEASASGPAVAEPGLPALVADATAHIAGLQSVGTGGSLMDQAWRELDQPLLLKLVPQLKSKVEQARLAAASVTTTRYDEASATLSLRNGTAALSDARLSMPGYRLHLDGVIRPFDDRLDLAARLVASPEETLRLTGGKDRSDRLPYEDGGLMIPLVIQGSLQNPRVLPDLDVLLRKALAGDALADELAPRLEKLSDSDKEHIQEGLQLLQGLGTLLNR